MASGARTSIEIGPGRGMSAPPGSTRRAPWMTAGTSGMAPRAAATNAPIWKRLRPTTSSKVPSGKNTSEWPASARRITRLAARSRPPLLARSTNSVPMRASRRPTTGMEAASRFTTKENRGGSAAFMTTPSR